MGLRCFIWRLVRCGSVGPTPSGSAAVSRCRGRPRTCVGHHQPLIGSSWGPDSLCERMGGGQVGLSAFDRSPLSHHFGKGGLTWGFHQRFANETKERLDGFPSRCSISQSSVETLRRHPSRFADFGHAKGGQYCIVSVCNGVPHRLPHAMKALGQWFGDAFPLRGQVDESFQSAPGYIRHGPQPCFGRRSGHHDTGGVEAEDVTPSRLIVQVPRGRPDEQVSCVERLLEAVNPFEPRQFLGNRLRSSLLELLPKLFRVRRHRHDFEQTWLGLGESFLKLEPQRAWAGYPLNSEYRMAVRYLPSLLEKA